MKAVYFDISDVVAYAMKNKSVSGIQRSVLNILEVIVRSGRYPVFGLVSHYGEGGFLIADLSFMKGYYSLEDFYDRFASLPSKRIWLAGKLPRYKESPLRRAYHYALLPAA